MENYKKSFTLIEIIVVLAIVGIFSGFGIAKYNLYTQQVSLKSQAKKIVDVIELAKKKAISGDLYQDCDNFQGYQVVINAGNYLLRFNCGGVYTTVQTYDMLNSITVITGTGSLNFLPLQGTNLTINSLQLKNSIINQCVDISISAIGIVNTDETLISC